ncbi:hypothetical protein IWW38_001750 [Coemansia aciculifera]|uniref:Uncharacterized protein n=1 Tax=Coemansia aciculifera TaxID=417176 RepID=A0ACC1M7C5_9FUNG|nr:hypothetical protein IWW38_001750 [Coemansia aciculifera]
MQSSVASNNKQPALSRVDRDLLDKARMAVVVDTNYFIDDLPLIQVLSRLAYRERLAIVVPSAVLQELDKLKMSHKLTDRKGRPPIGVGHLARDATRFLDNELGRNDSALRCQKLSEYVRQETFNDDKILDCCMYIIEHRKLPVAILTRDRNLTVKARANDCATCSDWTDGAAGLLAAILASGGLQVHSELLVDDPPLSMPMRRGIETVSPEAEQRSHHQSSHNTIFIADSDDEDMDVDMLSDSEVEFIKIVPARTPNTAVVDPVARPTTPLASTRSTDSGLPGPSNQQPPPEYIVLDESHERNRLAGHSLTLSRSAVEISQEIATYLYNRMSCGFSSLLIDRLQKGLPKSYAGSWEVTLGAMFEPPPWNSATVMLTIVMYYWDSIFSNVFPKNIKSKVRGMIPWVMRIEGVAECPQTRAELPPHLRFVPLGNATEAGFPSSTDGPFDMEKGAPEASSETCKLIHLAQVLLAQSALTENDSQERRRILLVDSWRAWRDQNKQTE